MLTQAAAKVAIIAQSEGTEITDLLVPFAVLSEAGIEVEVLATSEQPVTLWPAYQLHGLRTMDSVNPADYDALIVPAVLAPDEPKLLHFVQSFAESGGLTASICDGVSVLAEAGLLDGRQATGHFYSHKRRTRDYPQVQWIRDLRYVQDQRIISTAGVSASAPVSVYLVEQLLGADAADKVARRFGIDSRPDHDVRPFKFGLLDGLVMLGNSTRGLTKRDYVLVAAEGADEFSLALTADVLARTSRVRLGLNSDRLLKVDEDQAVISTRFGLKLSGPQAKYVDTAVYLPTGEQGERVGVIAEDRAEAERSGQSLRISAPASAIADLLAHVDTEFGPRTVTVVTKQLELPWPEK